VRLALACLLIGLVVGYLLGVRSGGADRAPSRSRSVETPGQTAARIDPAPNSKTETTVRDPAPSKVALRATAETVTPTARRDDLDPEDLENTDEGIIEVDFRKADGEARVWFQWVDMFGNLNDVGEAAPKREGGRIVRVEDTPGPCSVWWLDPSGRRWGANVVVKAGFITRLDAADPRYLEGVPIPPDLGLVEGRVLAASGTGLADYSMRVVQGGDSSDVPTSSTGAFSVTLRPGDYAFEIGDLKHAVTVVAGQRLYVEIVHEHEGDLLLSRRARLSLRPVAGGESHSPRRWNAPGGRGGAPYLKAGVYDVFEIGNSRLPWLLGRVTIRPGQATRLDAPLFKATMIVHLMFETPITNRFAVVNVNRIKPATPLFSKNLAANVANKGGILHFDKLAPGRYEVIVDIPEFEQARAEITIADKMVKVEIAPAPR